MPHEDTTLVLNGEVTLPAFAKALRGFACLIIELSTEAAKKAQIEWVIENLESSSAIVTARGISPDVASVEKVTVAFDAIGRFLEEGIAIPYSPKVTKRINSLVDLVNEKITTISFETDFGRRVIGGKDKLTGKMVPINYSFGIIEGHVESMSKRKMLMFKLWDHLFDKAVSCYVPENFKDKMKEIWDKEVKVSGVIGRKSDTGIPVIIKNITDIEIVEDVPTGTYKRAKGIFSKVHNDELPEITLRKLRDA